MKSLQTIENIHKIFDTNGSHPVLVTCDDRKDWVCKYDQFPIYLFNELVAADLARIWNIRVPETSLITVKEEHIPEDMLPQLQKIWFKKHCFGSLYHEGAKEIDLSLLPMFRDRSFRIKVKDKSDFLKIALFDIWLSNEDRNYNNFNLLLSTEPGNIHFFYAIDHVAIFNSSNLKWGIAEITCDDSIIKTDLARILFSKNNRTKLIVNGLVENFYLCVSECKDQLPQILAQVPASWNLDIPLLQKQMQETIFTDEWLKTCENTFRDFIQSYILN